jgi:hypothetical protein
VVAVYLSGGTRFSATYDVGDADALVTGVGENDEMGWALAAGGDGDGDGYEDVAIGIFYDDSDAEDAGAAAVISGSSFAGTETYESAAYLLVRGLAAGDRFGYDVASPGDIDGDGLADFLLGSYLSDEVGEDAGKVSLFYGQAGINREVEADAADAGFVAAAAREQFGGVVDEGGDFDGDGLADFLAGAARAADGSVTEAGASYLFLGQDAGTWGADTVASAADLTVSGVATQDWAGDELAGGLDVDGNGYGDFAVGAQKADDGASDGGAVYVFLGP